MKREILYRAAGGVDFRFRFVWRGGENTWRIYIVGQPHYRGRAEDGHSTHRLGPPGNHWVCWDSSIDDYENALKIAAMWADGTMNYMATGVFTPPSRTEIPDDRSTYRSLPEGFMRGLLGVASTADSAASDTTLYPTRQPTALRRLLERLG